MIYLISNRSYRDTDLYYQIINPIIYPDFQEDWQSEKAQGVHKMTHEDWFHNSSAGELAKRNWNSSMSLMSDAINDTLVHTPFEEFVKKEHGYSILAANWSKMYKLGSLTQ